MPLTRYYRWYIAQKARRRKPEWQDVAPTTEEQRDTYAIAAANELRFSRAWLEALDTLITPQVRRDFRQAYETGSIDRVMEAMPFFYEQDSDPPAAWERFIDLIAAAYYDIVEESGIAATEILNRKWGAYMLFSMEPTSELKGEEVMKARRGRPRGQVPSVPMNPYSVEWIKDHGAEFVTQGVNDVQKKVIRSVLADNFERGMRASEALAEVEANLGLTERGYAALTKRTELMKAGGMKGKQLKAAVNTYRRTLIKDRAETIARTETITAQAQGRNDAWKIAEDDGQLVGAERVWISGPPSGNPYRPCPICLGLDGETAPISGEYISTYNGLAYSMPPAHPKCRCAETLRRAKK